MKFAHRTENEASANNRLGFILLTFPVEPIDIIPINHHSNQKVETEARDLAETIVELAKKYQMQ